ncbi:UMF1 family MFS transporter [Gemmobacter caeni]|uniref:UMF1 family MFS transporter n=1 Tax=Gemmobacter caeni TaxID=589035 RepID=A0A2T6B2W5_9RHOB|nr:MFS transporter [Gemmobacter caeni]PTX50409.1 UMF1 family MFS transporter [Gemmobacter caeni]TWI98374.1 UMF1 family MFS transporter [Gemmobacter caeni]
MVSAKKRIWGWFFFDWASQPYNTLLLTFVFGPYFAEVAKSYYLTQGLSAEAAGAQAQAFWGYGQTISGVLIALLAPVLGAIADGSGRRMIWIWVFSAFYVIGSWGLWYLPPEMPDLTMAMMFFGLGLIGMEFATIFTNSLMPSLADHEEMGKISGSGFAFGYLGGIISLVIMLLFLAESGVTGKTLIGLDPVLGLDAASREGTRAVGPFTALWYIVFMVPFFLWVRETPGTGTGQPVKAALADLGRLLKTLPSRQSLFAYLMSSMFYRDSLNALYGFGGVYASGVLGWSVTQIGIFGIIGAISASLATWIGGKLDAARGPKPVIVMSVWVLIVVCAVIVGMSREQIFGIPFAEASGTPDIIMYLCGILIGAAGGTVQAASRTMMVFHTTPERATEAFGLFALSGKATSFIAPFAIAVASDISGSQRIGVAPLIGLFLIGLILLIWVKPNGERAV